ncbi:MAG: hypothetical protein LBS60_14185 [Deltaproteobacteria bacterium]|jgi:hypothetical protein|nr:hypothetical protein [Deltaproteobacteria bacterium]
MALLGLISACGIFGGDSGDHADPTLNPNAPPLSLTVEGDKALAGVAPADQGEKEAYHTVWVASYLDPGPAQRAAENFRRRGLLAFTVKKTLVDKRGTLFSSQKPVGDYYLVNVGLFGSLAEAQILGRRLRAQGLIANWQAIGAADPGEMAKAAVQVAPQVARSEKVTSKAMRQAGQPLPPTAPAVTGQGFKRMVEGQYVASFRDPREAKAEAERLTAAGWPAAVERTAPGGANWFRVYLTNPTDHRDFKANPTRLNRDKAKAASQGGIVFLVDLSGLTGKWGQITPSKSRVEASACAGYSRPGLTLTGLERIIGQIPGDSPLLVALKSVTHAPPDGVVDTVVRPVRTWWSNDESELTAAKSVYGPTIFNRPQLTQSLRTLSLDERPVPIGPAFDNMFEVQSIPGRKVLIVWSDFRWDGPESETLAAFGRLKAQYGGQLELIVIYGDPDEAGYRLAENLAKTGGAESAYDGCLLLADQSYFQRLLSRVFARS